MNMDFRRWRAALVGGRGRSRMPSRKLTTLIALAIVSLLVVLPMLTPAAGVPPALLTAGDVKLSAGKRLYRSDQRPEFHLKLPAAPANNALGLFGVGRVYAAEDAITTTVSYKDHKVDVPVSVKRLGGGDYSLSLSPTKQLKPGRYNVEARIKNAKGTITKSESFAWGVLAVNTTKATYTPGETATLQMAVLSSTGNTLCAAPLKLTVTAPDGTTTEPAINGPENCRADQYSDVPDYSAQYTTGGAGTYQMKLQLADSDYVLSDSFAVAANQPFAIERTGPTRLFPPSPYTMKIKLTARANFTGTVHEVLPAGFTVVDSGNAKLTQSATGPALDWTADWQAGETQELTYSFKAPMVSPAFYFYKPLTLKTADRTAYTEARAWQMAGDAVITFVKETKGDTPSAATAHTLSATSTAGNTLILMFSPRINNATTPQTISVSDSAGNSWVSPATAPSTNPPYGWQGSSFNGFIMAYALNAAAITNYTVTKTSSVRIEYTLLEFANVATSSAVDQSDAIGRTSASSVNTPTLTTTNADDLLIGGMAIFQDTMTVNNAGSLPGSGWQAINTGGDQLGAAYQIMTATGSYRINFSLPSAYQSGTGIMAFKNSVGCTLATEDLMRGGSGFCNGVEAGFFWAS